MAKVQEILPKVWTTKDAFDSGKGGYRIKVDLTGNPFKGHLANAWAEGWQYAFSTDTLIVRHVDYAALEERYERNSRSRGRSNNRDYSRRQSRR